MTHMFADFGVPISPPIMSSKMLPIGPVNSMTMPSMIPLPSMSSMPSMVAMSPIGLGIPTNPMMTLSDTFQPFDPLKGPIGNPIRLNDNKTTTFSRQGVNVDIYGKSDHVDQVVRILNIVDLSVAWEKSVQDSNIQGNVLIGNMHSNTHGNPVFNSGLLKMQPIGSHVHYNRFFAHFNKDGIYVQLAGTQNDVVRVYGALFRAELSLGVAPKTFQPVQTTDQIFSPQSVFASGPQPPCTSTASGPQPPCTSTASGPQPQFSPQSVFASGPQPQFSPQSVFASGPQPSCESTTTSMHNVVYVPIM